MNKRVLLVISVVFVVGLTFLYGKSNIAILSDIDIAKAEVQELVTDHIQTSLVEAQNQVSDHSGILRKNAIYDKCIHIHETFGVVPTNLFPIYPANLDADTFQVTWTTCIDDDDDFETCLDKQAYIDS
jgi:hypothetical protein